MMRRSRPLARAAMIGGTAYVAGRAGQRSAQREADQNARLEELEAQQYQQQQYAAPPPAPAPAAGGGTDLASQIANLKSLLDQGVLTQDQFEAAKQKLLAS